MDIQTQDGILLRNIPEGTPDDVIKARLAKIRSGDTEQTVQQPVPQRPLTNDNPNLIDRLILENFAPSLAKAPDIQATVPGRLIQGAGRLGVGATQFGANLIGAGDIANQRVAEISQRTQALRGPDAGFDWAGLVGELANPAVIMTLSKIPAAVSAAQRIMQGAGVGATTGALSPVTQEGNFAGQKAMQVGIGTTLGAAIPAGFEGAKAVGRGIRNVVQPHFNPDAAAARIATEVAGPKTGEVIQALKTPEQLVPGATVTAGQAAAPTNAAEFAALQKIVAERAPSTYFGPKGIEGQQNAARLAAVRSVGRTAKELSDAEIARMSEAATNYGQAYTQAVKADPRLLKISENPYFKDALPDAIKLSEASGVNPKEGLTRFLHFVKISLDKQLQKTGDTALASTEKRAVTELQKELVTWLGTKNPAYESARAAFAQSSGPINQMRIGQYLEDKLVPALSEETKQRAAGFAQAIREAPQTIKRAGGGSRFQELSEVMTPEQMATLTGVQRDLARDALSQDLARRGMKSAQERLGQAVPEVPPTGMFSPILSVSRGFYNRVTGKATDKTLDDLTILMQNPQKLAKLMESASPKERKALVDGLLKYQSFAAASSQ